MVEHEIIKNGGLYSCRLCDYTSKKKYIVQQHILSKHEGVSYECINVKCNYKTTHPTNLKWHVKSAHGPVTHKCGSCEYKASHKHTVRQHFESVHEQVRYECDVCEAKFKAKHGLRAHLESNNENKGYNCA